MKEAGIIGGILLMIAPIFTKMIIENFYFWFCSSFYMWFGGFLMIKHYLKNENKNP